MKSPYFIIIRGPLGIGKSTIAKELAKKFKGEYISIDSLLEKLKLDKIEGDCIPLKNFLKVNMFIIPKIKEKLNKKRIVILDGNFYHKQQIKDLIKNLKFKHFVFTLKAPLSVCIERDKNRKKAYGKEATIAVYNLVSKFDYGIVIDTKNKNINAIVKEITKLIYS